MSQGDPAKDGASEANGVQAASTTAQGGLLQHERWWKDKYNEILERGYKLRPRYQPLWKPSWKKPKKMLSVEDGQATARQTDSVMDAVCEDKNSKHHGKQVLLKKLPAEEELHEFEMNQFFSSDELSKDPRNHCARLLDWFELPGVESYKIMVFPILRPFDHPQFRTFGEFVAFFTQICEGIEFMHTHNIAYRDCTANNVMLDPTGMYPKGFHPVKRDRSKDFKRKATAFTRTQRPPRYYFINLGRCETREVHAANPPRGDAPASSNPFYADVYSLGKLVDEEFVKKYRGFKFMDQLITEMTKENPTQRPKIEEVRTRFDVVQRSLSRGKLRSLLTPRDAYRVFSVFRRSGHWLRTLGQSRATTLGQTRSQATTARQSQIATAT